MNTRPNNKNEYREKLAESFAHILEEKIDFLLRLLFCYRSSRFQLIRYIICDLILSFWRK